MTAPSALADVAAAVARLDQVDWNGVSEQRFGTDKYADWCHLNRREQIIRAAGCCTCCSSVVGREPAVAVARWTGRNGHSSLLCGSCLAGWETNAAEAPDLAYVRLEWLDARSAS